MAKYELPIYGENDELVKTYATNICPWAVYVQAAEMQDELKEKSAKEQIAAIGELLMVIFKGLTREELLNADGADVMNTFKQIVRGSNTIEGNEKNV